MEAGSGVVVDGGSPMVPLPPVPPVPPDEGSTLVPPLPPVPPVLPPGVLGLDGVVGGSLTRSADELPPLTAAMNTPRPMAAPPAMR
jgi:hypothetical protein